MLGTLCAEAAVLFLFVCNNELPKCHAVEDAVRKPHIQLLFHWKIMEFSLGIRNCTLRELAFRTILGPPVKTGTLK